MDVITTQASSLSSPLSNECKWERRQFRFTLCPFLRPSMNFATSTRPISTDVTRGLSLSPPTAVQCKLICVLIDVIREPVRWGWRPPIIKSEVENTNGTDYDDSLIRPISINERERTFPVSSPPMSYNSLFILVNHFQFLLWFVSFNAKWYPMQMPFWL